MAEALTLVLKTKSGEPQKEENVMARAFTAGEFQAMATEAGLKLNEYVAAIAVYDAKLEADHDARSASPDDREKITACAESMDGAILDATVEDLLSRASVRKVQGTSAFARHTIKRLSLQYQPVAAATT